MDINRYKASYSFVINFPDCKVGKEEIQIVLNRLIKKLSNKVPIYMERKFSKVNECITYNYKGEYFANLFFDEILSISDYSVSYTYSEYTDQQIMLPNIYRFVYMLMLSIKTAEVINNGFKDKKVSCNIKADNNGYVYFYEKYSPVAVDYSKILKYKMDKIVNFKIGIDDRKDILTLFNRFYHQYKSDHSIDKPFVSIISDDFLRKYDDL